MRLAIRAGFAKNRNLSVKQAITNKNNETFQVQSFLRNTKNLRISKELSNDYVVSKL